MMECCVHSPCGRYLVKYKSDTESMCIDVIPKVSAPESSSNVHYCAILNEGHVLEITAAAGVRKDFASFADMAFNAMIGRSPSVKFFVETCEEMKNRITTEVEQRGHGISDITFEDSDASLLSESSRTQRFFSLDYDVDFTRAVFPVPLVQKTAAEVNSIADSMRTALPAASPEHRVTLLRGGAAKPEAGGSKDKNKALVEKLQAENEKLKRENEALVRLSREKMLEMQRLCEDFQHRVEGEHEVERLKKKMDELRERLRRTEAERDEAHAAFAQLKRRTLYASPRPDGDRCGSTMKRRSRFDTPPAPVVRRSSSRLLGDSPAPRGRTGCSRPLCAAPRPSTRSRSATSRGGGAVPEKRRLWSDKGGSRCSSASGSRCSSCGGCERLYRTPTVSSRLHQRDSPVYVSHRAVFR